MQVDRDVGRRGERAAEVGREAALEDHEKLLDVLEGKVDMTDVLLRTNVDKLTIMPSGTPIWRIDSTRFITGRAILPERLAERGLLLRTVHLAWRVGELFEKYGAPVVEASMAELLDRADGCVRWLSAAECGFAYRQSRFKHEQARWRVLAVRVVDAVNDPLIGWLVDRWRPAFGRRRTAFALSLPSVMTPCKSAPRAASCRTPSPTARPSSASRGFARVWTPATSALVLAEKTRTGGCAASSPPRRSRKPAAARTWRTSRP